MSISNEILRIQTAKENLKSSIQRKDVTVPSTTKIDGYPPLVDSIGGGEEDPEDAVRFFDYDGTLLYQYSAAEFLQLSAMPANPSHTGLVAQGWNWSLEDAQEFVAEWGYQDIGQMYITESGDTEIDVEFPTGFKRLSPYMRIAVNGTVEIDWGDGSAVETVTGTSLTTNIDRQHTYASDGSYTIVIHVVSGGFAFYTNNNSYSLLHNNHSTSVGNRIYSNRVRAIRIGNNCTLGAYCLGFLGLVYITIPNTILGTGNSGFQNCYFLNCIIIPNNMTTIQFSMVQCYGLSIASFPKSITSCSTSFSSCYMLDRLIFPPNLNYYNSSLYNETSNTSRDVIIPYRKYKRIFEGKNFEDLLEGQSSIPSYYFANNISLKKIVIPSDFSEISSNAFYYCTRLKSIELPDNLETIRNASFYNCCSLKNINIPTNIKRIESSAFQSCYSIKSLYIPDGVSFNSSIFYYMYALKSIRLPSDSTLNNVIIFQSNYSLEDVEIPVGITSINNNAFTYCYSLPKLTIPSGVTSIGNSAFSSCGSLSELTIPANVTSIGAQAFYNCYGMKEYHFLPTTPPTITNTNVFSGIPSDCIIYVPQGCLEAYQTAQYWSTYASYMQEEPTQTR